MRWLEYARLQLEKKDPPVDLRDVLFGEWQDWYRDYKREYPEDAEADRKRYEII